MTAAGQIDVMQPHRRVGLVVVHGVGETEPGQCVNALLETLAATKDGYRIANFNEFSRLSEPEADSDDAGFPVARRLAAHQNGTSIDAVELHWADLSEMQPGRLNTLLGFFRVIFESHHLVDAMLDRGRDMTSALMRKLLWFAGWMLRGPSAALTIATSAICALLLFEPVSAAMMIDAKWQFLAVQAALFVVAVTAFYKISGWRDYSWYDTIFWLGLTALVLFLLALNDVLLPTLNAVPDLTIVPDGDPAALAAVDCNNPSKVGACYINGLYKMIIWGWRFWGFLLLVCTGLLLLAISRARKTSDYSSLASLSTSIGILILQFLLWTTVVVSVLYPMLNRAETNSTLQRALPLIENALHRGEIKMDDPVVKLVQVPDIELEWIHRFKFIFAATAMTVLLLLLTISAIMELRRRRAHAGLANLERTARRMPRLLFNPFLVTLLIIAFLVVITLIIFQPYLDKNEAFVHFRNLVLPFAAAVAVVTPFFFGRRIANVVHIARDLIDHHYIPRLETATYFFPSLFRTRHARPRRMRIQNRLKLILTSFVMQQRYDDVIFVAHSQGSVIVYDYLHDSGPGYGELGGARPALVTFGSPLGPLYQKYFHEYASRVPAARELAIRLRCWINLYRVDDYIGGRISPPPGLLIDNRAMGLGGHTSYWSEPEIADALDSIIAGTAWPPPLPAGRDASAPSYVHAMRGT